MRRPNSGFAVGPVVLMVALLAIVGAATVKSSSKTVRGERIFTAQGDIVSQARYIANRINQCVLIHDSGNNGTAFNIRYPAGATVVPVNSLTCPGQPAPNGLWTGQGGQFTPKPIKGFAAWQYVNDAAGVKVTLASDGTADSNTIISSAATKFSADEASYAAGVFTFWLKK